MTESHSTKEDTLADKNQHNPIDRPAAGPLPKREPSKPGTGVPMTITTGVRPDATRTTSPTKFGRTATGK